MEDTAGLNKPSGRSEDRKTGKLNGRQGHRPTNNRNTGHNNNHDTTRTKPHNNSGAERIQEQEEVVACSKLRGLSEFNKPSGHQGHRANRMAEEHHKQEGAVGFGRQDQE